MLKATYTRDETQSYILELLNDRTDLLYITGDSHKRLRLFYMTELSNSNAAVNWLYTLEDINS